MRIGFIGLGGMGAPMAMRLLRAGHALSVHDLRSSAMAPLVAAGAGPLDGAAEAARRCEVVFTSLPTPASVESVYLGADGLVGAATPGQILVDLSTILPRLAKEVHQQAAKKGVEVLDCPVSGGTKAAREGTLALMAGGREDAFHRVEGLLRLLGQHLFHVGPSGMGSLAKLINQLFMGINNAGVLEGIALAERSGIEMDTLLAILSVSSGASVALQNRAHRIVNRDTQAGASVDIVEKDMALVLALAADLGSEVPMAARAHAIYQEGKEKGLGRLDITAISDFYRKA
jgi:3-hydroxyisobutyrate dehydrogenase